MVAEQENIKRNATNKISKTNKYATLHLFSVSTLGKTNRREMLRNVKVKNILSKRAGTKELHRTATRTKSFVGQSTKETEWILHKSLY